MTIDNKPDSDITLEKLNQEYQHLAAIHGDASMKIKKFTKIIQDVEIRTAELEKIQVELIAKQQKNDEA